MNELVKIDISIIEGLYIAISTEGLYIATSEDLPGLFVTDRNIIDFFNEIPEVIKAIKHETRRNKAT